MISLIICSRTFSISDALAANIAETIGVPYEIIVIDNSQNKYNIFQAYNLGVSKSRHAVLCFMHDDIEYHTKNWGQNVISHFEDQQTGVIGIAGTPYLTGMPGSWWAGGLINESLMTKDSNTLKHVIKATNDKMTIKNRVVVLDGVWFCIRQSLFNEVKFDEETYNGFHFYDIDISLQIHMSDYKLYAVTDVHILHFGKGNMDKTWLDNARAFGKKWASELPVFATKLNYGKATDVALKTLNEFVQILLANNMPQKKAYRIGLAELLKFYQGYFYYKTPIYLYRYAVKAFF